VDRGHGRPAAARLWRRARGRHRRPRGRGPGIGSRAAWLPRPPAPGSRLPGSSGYGPRRPHASCLPGPPSWSG